MRMERIPVPMSHSTAKAFRRYAQIHDVDLCVAAKKAVTENCRTMPAARELISKGDEQERIFISLPDTAMRLLELWSESAGIPKAKMMEWAIRKLVQKDSEFKEEA